MKMVFHANFMACALNLQTFLALEYPLLKSQNNVYNFNIRYLSSDSYERNFPCFTLVSSLYTFPFKKQMASTLFFSLIRFL